MIGVAAVTTAEAQQVSPPPAGDTTTASWRLGVFVGAAHHSPASGFLGSVPGRDHLFVGLQALTTVLRVGEVRVAYAAQLLPAVLVRGRTVPTFYSGPVEPDGTIPGPNVTYAVGASPFGLEVAGPLGNAVQLYGAAAAGGLIFTRPFPVPEAQRFNFTLEYGGGLLLRAGHERWVQLGYKFHHLSNAYTALANPGLDANVFYVGYQWSARLPR
jgi:hypothetical protein